MDSKLKELLYHFIVHQNIQIQVLKIIKIL